MSNSMLSIYEKKYSYEKTGNSLVFIIDDQKTTAKHRLTLTDLGRYDDQKAPSYRPPCRPHRRGDHGDVLREEGRQDP